SAKVKLASAKHRRLFAFNVVWLVFAGLVTVWLSWRVWRAGNDEQSAMADAASERMSIVEGDTAKAKADLAKALTKQAETELKLQEVRKRQDRRIADWSKFTEALKGKP